VPTTFLANTPHLGSLGMWFPKTGTPSHLTWALRSRLKSAQEGDGDFRLRHHFVEAALSGAELSPQSRSGEKL
jgi:hypothetical protein